MVSNPGAYAGAGAVGVFATSNGSDWSMIQTIAAPASPPQESSTTGFGYSLAGADTYLVVYGFEVLAFYDTTVPVITSVPTMPPTEPGGGGSTSSSDTSATLSSGEIAGVSVGVAVVVLLIILVAHYCGIFDCVLGSSDGLKTKLMDGGEDHRGTEVSNYLGKSAV